MAKFNINTNGLSKYEAEYTKVLPVVTMKFRGRDISRAFTAVDEGEDDGSRMGGLVINPDNNVITGVWEWDTKAEANPRFLSFKEKDENGNFRLHRGGSPICGALRSYVLAHTAA